MSDPNANVSSPGNWKPVYDGDKLLMSVTRVKLVSAASITTLLLSILDINIMSAIAWRVVADLDAVHGIDRLPWLTSCYALADCVAVPLIGKLADEYGPRPLLAWSLGIFAAGSLGCGLAHDMTTLIVARTVQGVGAGGLTAITLVVTGILFVEKSTEEKPITPSSEVGASAAVMFGIGLALGPTMGGLIADHLGWRWVFFLNVPFAVVSLIIVATSLRLPVTKMRRRIDYLGAALMGGAAAAALLVAEWGGQRYAWSSRIILGLSTAAVVLAIGFVWRSLTAPEPLVSLSLSRNPIFRLILPISLLAGVGLAGGLLYITGYLQVGRGLSTSKSGLMILCMAGGMFFSIFVARGIVALFRRAKYLLVAAGVIQAAVLIGFNWLTADTSYWLIGGGMFILGIGIGQSLGLSFQFLQSSVSNLDMGVATSSLRFVQQLGAALGFALYSTLVARYLSAHLPSTAGAANVHGELDVGVLSSLPAAQRDAAVGTFINATNIVFLVAAVISLLPSVLALFVPEPTLDTLERQRLEANATS
ncbi:MFS transporter [Actinoplanes sp. NPDC026619]|uniref:MFS transporter n=1 Tax=Actinoplanes sp. NPDC026619 TaxID=3155798 RepID=UPI0033D07B1D